MVAPEDLYETKARFHAIPRGLDLVVALEGFVDAGSALAQITELIEEHSKPIAFFNTEELIDYRAHRPRVWISEGEYSGEPVMPRLELHHYDGVEGDDFLALIGDEPDMRWESFTEALLEIHERLQIARTIVLGAFPLATPHTRELPLSVTGTDHDANRKWNSFRPDAQLLPAGIAQFVENRLTTLGDKVSGISVMVPHYVADMNFPGAAIRLIEGLGRIGDITIDDAGGLYDKQRSVMNQITQQVERSPELGEMLSELERRYDRFSSNQAMLGSDGAIEDRADLLADEIEAFLSTAPADDDPRPDAGADDVAKSPGDDETPRPDAP